MRILDKVLGWVGHKILAATQRDHTGWFVDWAQGGFKTLSGEIVNNDKAYTLSTVFACIRAISEDVGKLPLKLYKNLEPRGKEPLPKHRLYGLLHDQPNPEMTAVTFRRVLTAHALGWGNGFAEIERDVTGIPLSLWPLRPDRVRVFRLDDNRIWYEIRTEEGQTAWLRDDNILHIPGLGFDGLIGYNVIRYARECLGGCLAAQKFASSFFGNGVRSSGMLIHPENLSKEARENLRASFAQYQGAENANRLMILEEGLQFKETTIPPEDAQFLETRQFNVAEICRWFRMPPNKVADTTRAQGWSTLEQTNTDYVVDTLTPWLVVWEQEIWRKLLAPQEQRKGLFARHVVQGLLRGDTKTRHEAYKTGRNWGWLSADDIRELEDMNPLPDGKGDKYLIPLNMTEAGAEEEGRPLSFDKKFGAFINDAAGRIASAEIRTIESRIDKATEDRERFNQWIIDFYDRHSAFIIKTLTPLAEAWQNETGADFYMAAITEELAKEGIDAFTKGDPINALVVWKKSRKENIAILIKERAKNATIKTA